MLKINRDHMLEITRRMTPSRTAMTRIAGCYMDHQGFVDGTFNINFLKLSVLEKKQESGNCKSDSFCRDKQKTKKIFICRRTVSLDTAASFGTKSLCIKK